MLYLIVSQTHRLKLYWPQFRNPFISASALLGYLPDIYPRTGEAKGKKGFLFRLHSPSPLTGIGFLWVGLGFEDFAFFFEDGLVFAIWQS